MRNNWTREELLVCMNLYCKIPYGQFNVHSKGVNEYAKFLGRTPGAIAFKLVNFVSLDPQQQLLGRKGATNGSKLDKEVFKEFAENFDQCFFESEQLIERLTGIKSTLTKEKEATSTLLESIDETKQGMTKERVVLSRVNQDYFRKIVMANYTDKCAITRISIPELLVASHIKPWSEDKNNRLNPANGLCLSATFDKAFDRGLIALNSNYTVIFSQKLKEYKDENFYQDFAIYENKQIALPIKFLPKLEFLKFHYDNIFLG